jgi:Uma2 family endonuclease
MSLAPKDRMTVPQFLAWADAQDEGRFELWQGEVVAMSPENIGHARAKLAATNALARAIERTGVPCEAIVDGPSVAIDESTTLQPDAVVNCGPRAADSLIAAPAPVIVVEVLSPSTKHIDKTRKLQQYFRVAGLHHYLIVDLQNRAVVHHRRQSDDVILTSLLRRGAIALDPPGFSVAVEDLLV